MASVFQLEPDDCDFEKFIKCSLVELALFVLEAVLLEEVFIQARILNFEP